MRVAAVQMRSGTERNANLDAAETLIRAAAEAGARLVATPEMTPFLVRGREALEARLCDEADEPSLARMGALAAELGIYLLLGSVAVRIKGRAHNRSYLFGRDGQVLARYSKMHMFDADVTERDRWRESSTYAAGTASVVGRAGAWRVGLSVCYDLRFAELYRTYARAGCGLICVPAAFTVPTGQAHWETLLRARAIETGAYILAPAQGGAHADGRATWGRSRIIGPWGEVVAKIDDDAPSWTLAEIDRGEVELARERITAWRQEPRL